MAAEQSPYEVPQKETVNVGGIPVNVYREMKSGSEDGSRPITAVFMLHGRLSHCDGPHTMPIVEACFNAVRQHKMQGNHPLSDLIVITLVRRASVSPSARCTTEHATATQDHRNHGSRILDAKANDAWDKTKEKDNVRHAELNLLSAGTARDVSFVIDFLPARIVQWGVVGVSLGGHSSWILLNSDPRVSFGVPIIGGADFEKLMAYRIERTFGAGSTLEPPRYPVILRDFVNSHDPAKSNFQANDSSNPFQGKKILVLSGATDTLVPFSITSEFAGILKSTMGAGSIEVVVEEGAGHQLTPTATERTAAFVLKVLSAPSSKM
ncbi:hypothetical protein BKA62DRAFT_716621 [Auriculariales sp. MPI-PUGE-AT-0066]|nr:hypothetical protein BKA62DRAFT_716621 [Auriculariales sp. MPI-PUGE-AT-0066]